MSAPIGKKQVETDFAKEHPISPEWKSSHGMVPHVQLYNAKAPLDFEATALCKDSSAAKVNNLVHRYGI